MFNKIEIHNRRKMKSNFEENIKIDQGNKINSNFLIHPPPPPQYISICQEPDCMRHAQFLRNPIPTSPQSTLQSPDTPVIRRAGFTLQNTPNGKVQRV